MTVSFHVGTRKLFNRRLTLRISGIDEQTNREVSSTVHRRQISQGNLSAAPSVAGGSQQPDVDENIRQQESSLKDVEFTAVQALL